MFVYVSIFLSIATYRLLMTKRDIDLEDNMGVGIAVLSGATPQTAFEDYDVYAMLEDVSEVLRLEPVKKLQHH